MARFEPGIREAERLRRSIVSPHGREGTDLRTVREYRKRYSPHGPVVLPRLWAMVGENVVAGE